MKSKYWINIWVKSTQIHREYNAME